MSIIEGVGILTYLLIVIVLATWIWRLQMRRAALANTTLAIVSIVAILLIYATVVNISHIAGQLHQTESPNRVPPIVSMW